APRNSESERARPFWSMNVPGIAVSNAPPGSSAARAARSSPSPEDRPAGPRSTRTGAVARPPQPKRSTRITATSSIRATRTSAPRLTAFLDSLPRAPSIELHAGVRRHLIDAHPADLDVGLGVVLALHLEAREPAQHGELAGVRERVGDAPLEHATGLPRDRLPRCEVVVHRANRAEEAGDLRIPCLRRGVVPLGL